jgi:hypothetical protein
MTSQVKCIARIATLTFALTTIIASLAIVALLVLTLSHLVASPKVGPQLFLAPAQEVVTQPKTIEVQPRVIITPAPIVAIDDSMTTRQLRPIARDRQVPNWRKVNKAGLIAALRA